jgi:chromosome segregation protein
MYLKSIEVQGFKSFANKIVFDFHNGITGIVGPNGSGKSNVADAVRWVLGEQSAKQLRGSKMEDVIFAGTESRKPVGFAYVSITFDNADHALPVDYDEVTVARRVFRSGESEYRLNGHSCRLKDITELFYDTGIGKEGYSIIGQGQIDKILSGKPEERRELFDEAAGIVKFKRRKAAAQKKLDNERANLVRVNDILSELEKQVAPLEKQSEKAREYLRLKEELKNYDVNAFLLETEQLKSSLKDLQEKYEIAETDLNTAKSEYENTKTEYEKAENKLNSITEQIEQAGNRLSEQELARQRLTGDINVYEEQIKTVQANSTHFNQRLNDIQSEIAKKNEQIDGLKKEKQELAGKLNEWKQKQESAEKTHNELLDDITALTAKIESRQNAIYEILNEKSNITADNQKFKTMLEQLNIQKASLSSRIIRGKSEEHAQDTVIKKHTEELDAAVAAIEQLTGDIQAGNAEVVSVKEQINDLNVSIDKSQQQYHREKSRLESLVNITERYDGYGNSIRKVMELKDSNAGILGVIADIIKVEKKYETAIETALGGTIQNIVTDNENTAKNLIGYLKQNKLGRATFLPLSAIQVRNTLENEACMKENGVVGAASDLVHVSFEYEKLAKYLLGRILVVDNIDNALLIAKKYKHSLRIVTLEGEQLNPGGSMTGGAFKNSSNLLGRRREIEELKKSVSQISGQINESKEKVAALRTSLAQIRQKLDADNKSMRDMQLKKNTAELSLKQAVTKKREIIDSYSDAAKEAADLEEQMKQINDSLDNVSGSLASLDTQNINSQKEIDELNVALEEAKRRESEHIISTENIKIEYLSAAQKDSFIDENISRIESEIQELTEEISSIKEKLSHTNTEVAEKQKLIVDVKQQLSDTSAAIEKIQEQIADLKEQREKVNVENKTFFDRREKLNEQIAALDKECYRLSSQQEKLNESNDALVDYMWNEYELTYSYAAQLKDEALDNLSDLKKQIHSLKNSIRQLGDVNVNSIEEYKEVSERYTFLKGQHDDLIEAEKSLIQVIDDLDTGMRIQFEEKFKQIKVEFDKVFKELFGGGRGTIELVEGEDILEAGIVIISQPPGKKLQNMMQLSGGEKALTAISLLFAIQNLKPSPFCLLDEIEAALDDSNVGRYAAYLHKLTKHTQFIVITHRRGTMAAADRLYGITMQEKGVSALVSVDLIADDLDKDNKKE